MLVKEYEQYKSVYCSLCKTLGKEYGIFSRFILSYDSTLFAVFAMALSNECPQIIKGKCVFNPVKKCNYCNGGQEPLKKAAAITVISFYYKLIDDINDNSIVKKYLCRILKPIAGHWRKKASKNYKKYDDIIKNMLYSQFECEKDTAASIDKAAEPTATMLAALVEDLFSDDRLKIIGNRFGYYLGKWIYLIDAADDIYKDLESNNFNPFITTLVKDKNNVNKQQISSYCNGVLNQNISQCIGAFNLLDFQKFQGILNNIITEGMPQMQKKVLFDKLQKEENKNG